jgi:hypothetical protein
LVEISDIKWKKIVEKMEKNHGKNGKNHGKNG